MSIDPERFSSIRRRFVTRCIEDAAVLENYESADPTEVVTIAHRISGTAGMFGFSALGECAERLEDALRDNQPARGIISTLLSEINRLQLD